MTNQQFKKMLEYEGDSFKNESCCKMQLEIIKKIVNCNALDDINKLTMVNSYMNNLSTNNCILESLKEYKKQ